MSTQTWVIDPSTEIRRGEVRNVLLKLYNSGLSKSMIQIIHATINGPMSYALDDELIPANPVIGLTSKITDAVSGSVCC